MRKLIIGVLTTLLLVGGAGAASAGHTEEDGAGPKNMHGRCTAYFNGNKTGHGDTDGKDEDGNSNGSRQKPFAELEGEGTAYDEDHGGNNENLPTEQQLSDDVFEYCNDSILNPKGIGGNPEHNGRWDCRDGEENTSKPRDTDRDGAGEPAPDGEIECIVQDEAPN